MSPPSSCFVVLSGGVGGARFVQGLQHLLAGTDATVTVVANTADDIWMHGLKVCPDLDTLMYTLGSGIDAERGWGRRDETWSVKEELAAYGVEPTWFGLGDRDVATHLVRTQMLEAGYPLSAVTAALCRRWQPGVELLPMTDDRVETHVVVDDADEPSGRGRCTSRSTGCGCGRRCPLAPWCRSVSTAPRPHPACSRRSRRRTWCCSRPPTRWCRSAPSSACPGSARRSAPDHGARGRALPYRRRAATCAAWPSSSSRRSASR